MDEHWRSILERRLVLKSLAIVALIAGTTMLPYMIPERPMVPVYVSVPLAAISLVSMPGVMLSMALTGSTHDPKLLLAWIINTVLYGAACYWVAILRRRKRLAKA